MGTVAEPVPREHRELLRGMLARLPEFADRLAHLLSEEDEFYRQVDHVAPEELRQVCRANLERALTALAEGRGLALDAARKTGLVQARQGIPLPAVLRAFRIGGTFVYEALLELAGPEFLNPTRTIEINSYVWKAIDLYSDALTTAYERGRGRAVARERPAAGRPAARPAHRPGRHGGRGPRAGPADRGHVRRRGDRTHRAGRAGLRRGAAARPPLALGVAARR